MRMANIMHGGMVVSTIASQQQGPEFISTISVEFTCSPCVCMGSLSNFLPHSKDVGLG